MVGVCRKVFNLSKLVYIASMKRVHENSHVIFNFRSGKRRYDRKQSGYGGQTKPIFHKKVNITEVITLFTIISVIINLSGNWRSVTKRG